jgi:hypothetical protein
LLFEFKSPYSRILNNTVSNEYCHQIMAGMDIIRATSGGVFVQCDLKKYTGDEHFDNKYIDSDNTEKEAKDLPKVIGRKYYFSENLKPETLYEFTLDERSMYGLYGSDFTSIDGPVFHTLSGEKKFHDFGFSFYTKDLCTDEDRNEIMCGDITEYYKRLDVLMLKCGAFAYNSWKLVDINIHIFPSTKGFCKIFEDSSKKVIEQVELVDKMTFYEKNSFLEKFSFP